MAKIFVYESVSGLGKQKTKKKLQSSLSFGEAALIFFSLLENDLPGLGK